MTDTLDQIKQDFQNAGAADFLIGDPEGSWEWPDSFKPLYEVTMEVRENDTSFGTIHTADDVTFQIYAVPAVPASHSKKIAYRFDEDKIMAEIQEYIDSTYSKHYATNGGFQATDAIIATGNGLGFCVGNILKYAWRLGKKDGFNKLDIMKVIHYSIILMFIMKKESKK